MATIGTVTTGASDAATTTVAATVPATADPFLLVFVGIGNSTGVTQIDTVTWNTTESLTRIDFDDDGSDSAIEAWYLNNPSTGTHNVVVDYAGSATPDAGVAVIPINGVNSADPVGASNTTTTASQTPSIVVTTEDDNSIVFDAWSVDDNNNKTAEFTAGDNQTELFDANGGVPAGDFSFGGSYEETTSHGDITMSQTLASGSEMLAGIAVEIKVSATTGTASVSPESLTASVPSVTAGYEAILTAAVSPLVLTLTPVAVTAGIASTYIAAVSPLVLTLTPPAITAGWTGPLIAEVTPMQLVLTIPSVLAYNRFTPPSTSYTTVTPTATAYTSVTPTATAYDSVTSPATDYDEYSPS